MDGRIYAGHYWRGSWSAGWRAALLTKPPVDSSAAICAKGHSFTPDSLYRMFGAVAIRYESLLVFTG